MVHASGAPVFYEHAYVSAYEQAPLTNADYSGCFLVRDGGKLVGVLPVHLQSAANPLRRLHEVYPEAVGRQALLSHTWHCYDAHVPATAEVLPALLEAMSLAASMFGAHWYGFVNVQRGNALSQELRAAGLPARHLTDRWAIGLTTYDDYLARLGIRARANLRRNERRSREAGVTVEILPADQAALDEIALLCTKTAIRFDSNGFYPRRHLHQVRHGARRPRARDRGPAARQARRRWCLPRRRHPFPHLDVRRGLRGRRPLQPVRRAVRGVGQVRDPAGQDHARRRQGQRGVQAPVRPAPTPSRRRAHSRLILFILVNNSIYNVGIRRAEINSLQPLI